MIRFMALRSKIYPYLTDNNDEKSERYKKVRRKKN